MTEDNCYLNHRVEVPSAADLGGDPPCCSRVPLSKEEPMKHEANLRASLRRQFVIISVVSSQ